MTKLDFISTYEISDATPQNPTLEVISADGFSHAIEEFINDRFRGIARVRCQVYSGSSVLVSTEYAAYFFKILLSEIYGRVFLNINISSDTERLTIEISPEGTLPLCDKQLRQIIKIARNAGMQIISENENLRLTLNFADAAIRRIYAISLSDGRAIMLYKLGEIFHCGAVCQTVNRRE